MEQESDVNKRQVAGTHYGQGWMHWDWVCETGLGYLEGCWTKYVYRWRNKDGIEGLKKAIHYIDKAIELCQTIGLHNRIFFLPYSTIEKLTDKLITQGKCVGTEKEILYRTTLWQTKEDLEAIKECIQKLIGDTNATR